MPSDSFYMGLAESVAAGSKCERRQVGAVIVDEDGRIVSTGFNGQPRGVPNKCEDENTLPTVIHAELNAILFSRRSLKGCKLYVTMSPCLHCASCIIQSGIIEVVFKEPYRITAGIEFLNSAGIITRQYEH